jgi:hypothetical protein
MTLQKALSLILVSEYGVNLFIAPTVANNRCKWVDLNPIN